MKTIIKKTAIIILLLTIVGGGFLCLISAENSMNHAADATGNIDVHLSYANALNQGLIASVSVALASMLVLLFLPLFNTIDVGLSLPSLIYSRQKWREPPGIVQRRYSWLSLLVRSPGSINTA